MVKVYMFIYPMVMFFSILISIANSVFLMCRTNEDCRNLLCLEADHSSACGFPFHVTGSEGFGVCGCIPILIN
ncbi:unnamed protein product [Trifolium pratense]|uniref:Uncharacterized protein n=1 Tax=Trifolium pratense TaxID=57577 RepID=A0ACB0LCJ0_TRIPR|nr:unnamed protein product [Trifolium pratense]